MKKDRVVCPLCNNPELEIIQKFQIEDCLNHLSIDAGNQNYQAMQNKIAGLWRQDVSSFMQCNNCSLYFASPFISGDSEFYNLVYDEGEYSSEWKWDFEITYNILAGLIENYHSSDDTLLEIGAGDGSFIKRISESLIDPKNILTTEYSDYGRGKIHELQVASQPYNVKELLTGEYINSFKFICMFQVLEHLDNLDEVFKSLTKLLKINGHLFITVPNRVHRLEFEKSGIFEDNPPIHISRWDLDCFRFVEQKYGLKIIDYSIQPGNFKTNALKYLTLQFQKSKASKKIMKRTSRDFQKLMKLLVYSCLMIKFIKPLFLLSFKKDMGVSQWVHLRKVLN
jgi:SAM-dependent methyltransferase